MPPQLTVERQQPEWKQRNQMLYTLGLGVSVGYVKIQQTPHFLAAFYLSYQRLVLLTFKCINSLPIISAEKMK